MAKTALWTALVIAVAGLSSATGAAETHQHMQSGGGQMAPHASDAGACKDISFACARTATPLLTGDGKLWLIWDAAGRVLVSLSKDLGQSFGEPVEIYHEGPVSLDNGPDARPKIAIDAKGRLVAAFATRDEKYNGKVFLSTSSDGGKSFSPPRALAPSSPSQRFETIAFDPKGRLFTAWIDKRNAAAARAKGETYAGASLAYAWDADTTASPEMHIARDNSCECCRIGVAFTRDGRAAVLFRNIFEGGIRDHAVITFDASGAPGPVHRVSVDDAKIDACPHHGPSLSIAPDGTYHAVWMAVGTTRKGLSYARSTDGGTTFSEPVLLGAPGKQASRPFVLADKGVTYLAWKEFDGEKTDVVIKSSIDGGATWSTPASAASTTAQSDHPLLIAENGIVYLSWLTEKEGYRLIPLAGKS